MDQCPVVLQVDGPLARITLNRSEVLNAENLAWVKGARRRQATVVSEAPRPPA